MNPGSLFMSNIYNFFKRIEGACVNISCLEIYYQRTINIFQRFFKLFRDHGPITVRRDLYNIIRAETQHFQCVDQGGVGLLPCYNTYLRRSVQALALPIPAYPSQD